MGDYKLTNISDLQLKQSGVQALADRPNAAQQYGQSGLSATQLKLWFDKLATLLAKKVNELQDAIQGEDAAKYIGLALADYKTLDELIGAMQDGSFADKLLKLYPNENAFALASLQDIIYGIAQHFSEIEEQIETLDNSKLSKNEESDSYRRTYAVGKDGAQTMISVSDAPVGGAIAAYNESGILKSKMTPLPGYEAMSTPSEVVNMAFVNELRKHIGAGLNIVLDHQTYEFYVEILNMNGQVIFTSPSIDLPIEEVVVSGTYKDGKIILTLQNGNKIEIPVANMVDGLVTEAKHKVDIQAINDKVDTALSAYIVDVYQLLGGDFVDYS